MKEQVLTNKTTQKEIVCKNCSAKLTYAPGTNHLKCEHCGTENEILVSDSVIEELNFENYLQQYDKDAEKDDIVSVKCDACGAQTSFEANIVSDNCPFCGNPIIVSEGTIHHRIQPKSLLPFQIDRRRAVEMYSNWLKKLWWAPNDLLKYAEQQGKLVGMYIPYWTYDADANTSYSGERGEDYTEVEEYETTENGERVTRTRTITRTIWYSVSGEVCNCFDDILIVASQSLPKNNIEKLEPWDLQNLIPYSPEFLSGYKAENYQKDLKEGFEEAKIRMEATINQEVLRAIGGNHQRIHYMNSSYHHITFKHILLPLWISAYRYKKEVYRFMINGRTGEVQGERPYSWMKITLAVLAGIAVLALIILFL
jgi:LSD1 subclass zinc finger protein